jgi:hypothetical protein
MSSGDAHNDPYPFTLDEANRIIQLPLAARMMRRGYKIASTRWDIPYLAGYSQDGGTIYIDRDLEDWMWLDKRVIPDRFLILHEHVEKSLIDGINEGLGNERGMLLALLHMTGSADAIYYHTHGVATAIEEYAVKLQYGVVGLASYNKFMLTQVKHAESERILRVPDDLDMTPYLSSEDAEDRRLIPIMREHMVPA